VALRLRPGVGPHFGDLLSERPRVVAGEIADERSEAPSKLVNVARERGQRDGGGVAVGGGARHQLLCAHQRGVSLLRDRSAASAIAAGSRLARTRIIESSGPLRG
jgi:hypothetical protein